MPDVMVSTASKPIWVDLSSPDIEASKRFYGRLFGWDVEKVGGPEMGGYTFFQLRGQNVAAVVSIMGEGQHPAWTTYVGSNDVDLTAEKIRSGGGELAMGPMDVPGAGRICICRDPGGAFLGVFQPREHKGFDTVRVPGSFTWFELRTRDMPKAKEFYQQVFGWGEESHPMGPGNPDYVEWKRDGESVGGGMEMQPNMFPAEVPPHWLVFFQVENADRAAEQIKDLGGQVVVGPMDSPGGRFVIALDPHGAGFGVLQQPGS